MFRPLGISCAAVFLAAYCVVLHRLAEQDDILIGLPTQIACALSWPR